jgi:hypothetical protein
MMPFIQEQARAMRRAHDLEDLAGVLEGEGHHVLAGETRRSAQVIRALWSDTV